MNKFSDFSKEGTSMLGDKIKIDEILGKEITITGFKISDSKYQNSSSKKLLTLQISYDEINKIVFTGSKVLMEQVEKYEEEIPFTTKIERVNKFYTFT